MTKQTNIGEPREGSITVESIKVVVQSDDSPDTSFIGEYTDKQSDWAIERSSGEYVALLADDFEIPSRGREYRFFVPYAGGEKPGSADYQKYGKGDFDRMESLSRGDWGFVGVYAVAEVSYPTGNGCRRIERMQSSGLWGIESDSGEHLLGEMREQVEELKEHLSVFGVTISEDEFEAISKAAIENPQYK